MHKLLFDQNLSYRIVQHIESYSPGSNHVRLLNLEQSDDLSIWQYAKEKKFHIVTQDADFADLSTLYGTPPKIIWIRTGNTSTDSIIDVMQKKRDILECFLDNNEVGLLEIL